MKLRCNKEDKHEEILILGKSEHPFGHGSLNCWDGRLFSVSFSTWISSTPRHPLRLRRASYGGGYD